MIIVAMIRNIGRKNGERKNDVMRLLNVIILNPNAFD